jgi:trehalose 6-phosphate synthase/phosphatase
MNLVAKEFIATKTDQTGVLVLSEMAGATNELGRSIFVNPNDIPLVAESIHKALTMPVEEQKEGIASMQDRLKRYSVFKWAAEFINSLKDIPKRQAISQARKVSQSLTKKIIADYKQANKRLLFLDYDGTLQRFFKDPEAARPDDELMNLLHSIQTSDNTEIVLISGRDKETLNDWFGNEQFTLIAEHGVWLKKVNEKWVERNQSSPHWKENIRPVLESFVDRTPGSFIEEKSHSLAWHYRSSDIELGNLRAKDLVANVSTLIINQELEILEGNKVIEIKVSGINKGSAAMEYLQNRNFDFLMAIGDDWTDEHLFEVMPQNAITIKVGSTHSEAKYYIDTYKNVRQLLRKIVGH